MMKVIFLLLLIIISTSIVGQNNDTNNSTAKITEYFENCDDIPTGWVKSELNCFFSKYSELPGGKGIGLQQNGFLISPELPGNADIGSVVFWYTRANQGDNYNIIIEYESLDNNGNKTWRPLNTINPATSQNNNNLERSIDIVLQVIGAKKIKFSVQGNMANTLYLDNIEITPLDAGKKAIIEKENFKKEIIDEFLKNIENRDETQNLKNIREQLNNLGNNYIRHFNILLEISDKLNAMTLITEMGQYMATRVLAANPSNYVDFNTIINYMESYADSVDKVSLDEIKTTIDEETNKDKIETVSTAILNIITLGKFDNIVSGIKSIFRSIFKKGNPKIKKRDPILGEKGAKIEFEKLNKLLKIIEKENIAIMELRSNFQDTSKAQIDFEKEVNSFFTRYGNAVNVNNITQLLSPNSDVKTDNNMEESITNRNSRVDNIKLKINEYFTNLTKMPSNQTNFEKMKDEIDKLSINIQQVRQYTDKYRNVIVLKFKSLFDLIEKDGLNTVNPFDNIGGLEKSKEYWKNQKSILRSILDTSPLTGKSLKDRVDQLVITTNF